ncbi:MAG: purine-nucleoside phosphorylase [Xanthomonadales bacterium]|jgi:xanthosine phosphorylase|nr:purine-nucleoside phosphorylase [Xanthomonadales bacterium]
MSSISESIEFIRSQCEQVPKVALQLGSGLNGIAASLTNSKAIPYADIPGFYDTSVPGHEGFLHIGELSGVPVLCLQGRVHYYEGRGFEPVRHTIRTLAGLGVEILLLTNAAGSLNPHMPPGSLMSIRDHINLSGMNPLIGPNDEEIGPRFVDLMNAYDPELRELLQRSARNTDQRLYEGVYLMTSGPTFETPAEIYAFRTLGADAVGMSTVPECILARHAGLRVAAVSTVTNFAAGMTGDSLSHAETEREGKAAAGRLSDLLAETIGALGA